MSGFLAIVVGLGLWMGIELLFRVRRAGPAPHPPRHREDAESPGPWRPLR